VKSIEDQTQHVKDQALRLLGILKGKLGEEAMSPYLAGVDPKKMVKIDEAVLEVSSGATNLVSAAQVNQEERDIQIKLTHA
jgi:hypothetical protein